MGDLAAAGAVGFSDDGLPIRSARVMRRALQYQRLVDLPIALHEEDPELSAGGSMHEGEVSAALGIAGVPSVSESTMIARDCALAAYEEARIHVQHLSAVESVAAIEQAKAARRRGHAARRRRTTSTLTDEEVRSLDSRFKMNPPLRTEADRQALIEALRSGTIDCIATDHAPHTSDEKEIPFEEAAMGVTGLETAFAVLYTDLVHPGRARPGDASSSGSAAAPSRSASSAPRIAPRRRGEPDPLRPRRRVGGRGRGLGEPLRQLLLRRPAPARPGADHGRRGRVAYRQRVVRPGGCVKLDRRSGRRWS